jgi:hypothetical protein
VQDGVVVGVHITTTDSRTFVSRRDDTREVLTCVGCRAHVRKPIGLPVRLNAVVGDNGRSISGTVVNGLGETARVLLRI